MIVLDSADLMSLTRGYSCLYPAFSRIDDTIMLSILLTLFDLYPPNAVPDNLSLFILVTDLTATLEHSVPPAVIEDYVADIEDVLYSSLNKGGRIYDTHGYKAHAINRLYVFTSPCTN